MHYQIWIVCEIAMLVLSQTLIFCIVLNMQCDECKRWMQCDECKVINACDKFITTNAVWWMQGVECNVMNAMLWMQCSDK